MTTDDKTAREVEEMLSFTDAYPFPDYPKKSTSREQRAIDEAYYALMRRNGLEPHNITSMEFNKVMMKIVLAKAFPEK